MMNHQEIGDIAIFHKISKKEAEKFLKKFKHIKTVCVRRGSIKGKFRKPQVKVLVSRAKKDKTVTIHQEQGVFYKIDVLNLMFSKGNINERHRIAKIAHKNETVIDMFAGIGYFSIPLGKKVKKVYAIELNPVSYHYLLENIKLNKLRNVIAFRGNCANIVPKLKVKADRIVMGFLPSPFKYLRAAFTTCKKGTIIHYSCLVTRNKEKQEILALVNKINHIKKVKLIRAVKVKSYSHSKEHYVLDLKLP